MRLGAVAPDGPLGISVGAPYISGSTICPSLKQLQGVVDSTDPCQTGGTGPIVVLDQYGLSQQTEATVGAPSFGAIDWSNPSAMVQVGDTLPNGDTYAGPPTTVGQIQSDLGLATPPTSSVGMTPYLLLGGVVLLLVMIGGRR